MSLEHHVQPTVCVCARVRDFDRSHLHRTVSPFDNSTFDQNRHNTTGCLVRSHTASKPFFHNNSVGCVPTQDCIWYWNLSESVVIYFHIFSTDKSFKRSFVFVNQKFPSKTVASLTDTNNSNNLNDCIYFFAVFDGACAYCIAKYHPSDWVNAQWWSEMKRWTACKTIGIATSPTIDNWTINYKIDFRSVFCFCSTFTFVC